MDVHLFVVKGRETRDPRERAVILITFTDPNRTAAEAAPSERTTATATAIAPSLHRSLSLSLSLSFSLSQRSIDDARLPRLSHQSSNVSTAPRL